MQQFLSHYKTFHSQQAVNIQVISLDIQSIKILIKLSTKLKVRNTILNVVPHLWVHLHPCGVAIKTAVSISMHTATVCVSYQQSYLQLLFSVYQPINQVLSMPFYICICIFMHLHWFNNWPCTVKLAC
jgi:hypothetical protein